MFMDFDHAIASHSSWKSKLANYLKHPDHSMKAAEVALDDKCELGKWIAGEGKQFTKLPEFAGLKSDHSRFHQVAADVIRRADSGQNVSEEVVLGGKSEFLSASTAVVRSIMARKSKVMSVSSH
jgi:methyl-accepting chemotaxis protein